MEEPPEGARAIGRREFVMAGIAGTLGSLQRLRGVDRQFIVTEYGADARGIADSTSAFTSAISDAGRAEGIVIVPPGTFALGEALRVPNRVQFKGAGQASVLCWRNRPSHGLLLSGVQGVRLQGLALQGPFSWGVLVDHSHDIRISGCRIMAGRIPLAGYCGGVLITASEHVLLQSCRFHKNGSSETAMGSDIQVNGYGTGESGQILIRDNVCTSKNVAFNISCFDANHVRIESNKVSGARGGPGNNSGYGIVIYGTGSRPTSTHDNAVRENHVSDVAGSGIYLVRALDSVVEQNIVLRAASSQEDASLPVAGIAINEARNVFVTRNQIVDSRRSGISVAATGSSATSAVLKHNVISDAARDGISLRGAVANLMIVENSIVAQRTPIAGTGTDEQRELFISDNDMSTTGQGPFVKLPFAHRSVVRRNRFHGTPTPGIALEISEHENMISGNENLPGPPSRPPRRPRT